MSQYIILQVKFLLFVELVYLQNYFQFKKYIYHGHIWLYKLNTWIC